MMRPVHFLSVLLSLAISATATVISHNSIDTRAVAPADINAYVGCVSHETYNDTINGKQSHAPKGSASKLSHQVDNKACVDHCLYSTTSPYNYSYYDNTPAPRNQTNCFCSIDLYPISSTIVEGTKDLRYCTSDQVTVYYSHMHYHFKKCVKSIQPTREDYTLTASIADCSLICTQQDAPTFGAQVHHKNSTASFDYECRCYDEETSFGKKVKCGPEAIFAYVA